MHYALRFSGIALALSAASSLAGCIIDDGPPRRLHDHDQTPSSSGGDERGTDPPSSSSSSSSSGSTPSGTPAPMLVEVDTDKTMTADPGDGVGVFVEYAHGGKWHVWWTCDTNKTQQDCDFSVSITAAAGTLSNLDASALEGGFVATPTESRIEAQSKTSTQTHGVTFTGPAGGVITVQASVGGLVDGAFLFFVQDGKVNGGYSGKLTNPLQLQGKTP